MPMWQKIRNWLLLKIAGNMTVAINLKIEDGAMVFDGKDPGLINNCHVSHSHIAMEFQGADMEIKLS